MYVYFHGYIRYVSLLFPFDPPRQSDTYLCINQPFYNAVKALPRTQCEKRFTQFHFMLHI